MGFHDLHQTGAWTHGEVQFVFEARDQIERSAVVKMGGSQVGVRREDTDPAGEPAQIASDGSVLVVLRNVHRVKPDGVHPMPCENIGECLIEDRKPVVHRSLSR